MHMSYSMKPESLRMYRLISRGWILLPMFLLASAFAVTRDHVKSSPRVLPGDLPTLPREFRAAWVATVANIDWPSRPGLPVAQQKAELVAIMKRASELNLNAIIFQVRPACDAMYR